MTQNFSKLDFKPLPWPVKPAVLFLLGLPSNASINEYEAAWNKAVEPARAGDWAKTQFNSYVERLQAEKKIDFTAAWNLAGQTSEGRRLGQAYRAEAEAKKQI